MLHSGFFVACAKLSGRLRKLLALPKGHKVAACLVIGYTGLAMSAWDEKRAEWDLPPTAP